MSGLAFPPLPSGSEESDTSETDSSVEETMKELLDRGYVKASWLDRQFFFFLDMKEEHGRELLNNLKEFAETRGYDWGEMAKFEHERRSCAQLFMNEYGMTYWGFPGRQKYLRQECLDNEESLCTYPAMREEITRTLVILLERKSKGYAHKAKPTTQTPASEPMAKTTPLPGSINKETPGSYVPKHADRKGKRKSAAMAVEDEDYAHASEEQPVFKTPRTRAITNAIKPFQAEPAEARTPETPKPLEINIPKQTHTQPSPAPKKNSLDIRSKPIPTPTPDKKAKDTTTINNNTLHRSSKTKFLVTASSQEMMAPVWLPYEDFTRADDFVDTMAQQYGLIEWSPAAQLRESTMYHHLATSGSAAAAAAAAATIVAASVKFGWSDFETLVRRDKDQDWKFVKAELKKAWKAEGVESGSGSGSGSGGIFKIYVKLHVS
ncbi:hypothetical protein BO70DRAFT_427988 [Aspergillus heteromorphus CBS 117.55]|uniref:Uncharacterized protein n=1 Tax=Aspergillus heteromorphus CBS 117.55 TaxID=1448321 RepID=A0A317WPF8_9EURO|nr:uncharacterized protein BO70DRAFT_427988 [Aspergillus heteromorphus CBS 117.55]PWY86997.1 hypothetical protein BO70DRAFT_427988 [Aspergillus heteromorphus CBS 117.55]